MKLNSANISLPRSIPGSLKLKVFFGQFQVMFGSVFFFVGLFMAAIFVPTADFASLSFHGNEPTASAIVTNVQSTNSSENKKTIYEYQFHFRTADGKEISGTSYLPGSPELQPGDTAVAEYLLTDPHTNRIRGMNSNMFGLFTLFVLIFPFIGILMLLFGMVRARKNIYLLRNGILTYGTVTRKEATNTKINNSRVYKIFFRFKANGTEYETYVRTHNTGQVLDEKEEALVYDSAQPEKAVLLDSLPSAVRSYFESGAM